MSSANVLDNFEVIHAARATRLAVGCFKKIFLAEQTSLQAARLPRMRRLFPAVSVSVSKGKARRARGSFRAACQLACDYATRRTLRLPVTPLKQYATESLLATLKERRDIEKRQNSNIKYRSRHRSSIETIRASSFLIFFVLRS